MIISDKIYIPLSRLGARTNDLAKIFTYQNAEYFEKSRMGFSTAKCSPFLAHYAFQKVNGENYIVLPRGAIKRVKSFLEKFNIPLRYVDGRNEGNSINVSLVNTILETQQESIIDILLKNEGGLIEMLPGGGKTIAALGLISRIKKSTLILVHEHRLRTQWESEIKERLAGTFTLGRYDGDKREEGDIVIGLINSVYLMYKDDKHLFDKFGIVITDECFVGSSRVLTDKGYKKIKNIKKDEKVLTLNENTRELEYKSVLKNIVKQTEKNLISIKLSNGTKITCTEKHKINTVRGWIKARELTPSDILYTLHPTKNKVFPCQLYIKEIKNILVKKSILNWFSTKNYVYDLSITDNHNYFVEGVSVHNCHHIPAHMYTLVVNNIPAKYRIGLTGTVRRKDQKELLLYDTIGPTLVSIGAEDLKHRVTSFEYEIVETNCKIFAPTRRVWADGMRLTKIDYVRLLSLLVTNKDRNTLILEKIVESLQQGYKPLILSDRVEHCKFLYNYLKDLGYNTVLLIGATRKQTNWEEIRQDDSIQAIVAQRSIAEEGLDYPSLSALHLTCPSTNLPKLKQRVGRIRRVSQEKLTPKVYDYVDNLVEMKDMQGRILYPLKRSARSRESFYKQLKKEYETTTT